jgi:FkbM family methyltransferase
MKASRTEQLGNLDLAFGYVENFKLAVDVGANVGDWTARMAARFDQVVAFEPGRDVFKKLLNVALTYGNVRCYNDAVGDVAQADIELVSLEKKLRNSQSRYVRKAHRKPGEVFINPTSMVTLDGLGLSALGLLKIDVEGAEMLVLRGAETTVKTFKPVIVVEKSSYGKRYGYKESAVDDLLTSWGAAQVAFRYPDKIFTFQ